MSDSQTQRLYGELRQRIRTAQIQPGAMLLEPDIAKEYGVSRTPARETLRLLAADGWLTVVPRKGYFVRPLEVQDVVEVMQLRLALEPVLAAEAATRSTDALSDDLAATIAQQHRGDLNRDEQLVSAEVFHLKLAQASGNRRAQAALRPLLDEISRLHHLFPPVAEHVVSGAERDAHEQIAQAVQERDASAASALMREHLLESQAAMFAAFQPQPY